MASVSRTSLHRPSETSLEIKRKACLLRGSLRWLPSHPNIPALHHSLALLQTSPGRSCQSKRFCVPSFSRILTVHRLTTKSSIEVGLSAARWKASSAVLNDPRKNTRLTCSRSKTSEKRRSGAIKK